jgi:two-component system, LytTR family, response regulator
MKVLVIDDFRLARLELISLLGKHKDIDIIGESDNGTDALALIQITNPDVIFTDINMPGVSVFEFLENIDESIHIVFTTSYADYAIKSFSFNTVDYLLKPISQERFDVAIEKIRQRLSVRKGSDKKIEPLSIDSKIMIKSIDGYLLKSVSDIMRIEAKEKEALVYFTDFFGEIAKPLTQLEMRLPQELFFRVSRQTIVNIRFVSAVIASDAMGGFDLVMTCGTKVATTRRQFSKIRDLLVI